MAMDAKKPKQIRVYLLEEELEVLSQLVEITTMKDTAILSHLLKAALRAAKDAEYQVPLALKFNIVDAASESPKSRSPNRLPKVTA